MNIDTTTNTLIITYINYLMNLIPVIKLLCSLLAAFFIGYLPVYFLFEYKKGCQKEYKKNINTEDNTGYDIRGRSQPNKAARFSGFCCKAGFNDRHNISKQIFIFFISIYFGFFIISNYLILLSLFKIKFGFLNAAVFGLIFCAAFIFIQILKFIKTKQAGENKYFCDSRVIRDCSDTRDLGYVGSPRDLKSFPESIKGKTVFTKYTKTQKENDNNLKENDNNLKEYDENQKGDESNLTDDKGNKEENKGVQKEKICKISLTFQVIFAFLIFINFCVVAFFTFLFPIRFWDAISCWSLKGRAFFLDGSVTAFYTQHQYTFTHLTYPLYISLSQTWMYIWLGEINETLVKAIFPLFYLSLIFIVYYLLRKEVKRLYAIMSVFIISSLPVVMDHGYLEYTNLIFSVVLLLGVYYFYEYILKGSESYKNADRQNQNAHNQNRKTQTQIAQNQPAYGQVTLERADKDQLAQSQFVQKLITQKDNSLAKTPYTGENIRDNLKNLIISAVFFAILVSIRSEGILFLVIFLIITTVYNLAVLPESFSSKRSNIILNTAVSIILPAALIFLLLAPWTILQVKLNISGASTEWAPVIESLKDVFKNILNGSVFVPGGSSEISNLFSFKNATGAFLGEFLFSKFDSARAFLGSSYGIAWLVLAVMAVFNFKKLFKAFNWIFFVFLSAGFIALFISLGFIAEFAWSAERYMLHLFPLAYFWIMRPYLSNTILLKSFAPEK